MAEDAVEECPVVVVTEDEVVAAVVVVPEDLLQTKKETGFVQNATIQTLPREQSATDARNLGQIVMLVLKVAAAARVDTALNTLEQMLDLEEDIVKELMQEVPPLVDTDQDTAEEQATGSNNKVDMVDNNNNRVDMEVQQQEDMAVMAQLLVAAVVAGGELSCHSVTINARYLHKVLKTRQGLSCQTC